MSWRFRRSIKIAKGVRLNVGKTGLGISAGVRGARIGFNKKGTYTNTGIPGTGLYSINYLNNSKVSAGRQDGQYSSSLLLLGGIVLIISVIFPPVGIVVGLIIAIFIGNYLFSGKEKAKRKLKKARDFFNQGKYSESLTILLEAEKLDSENQDIIYLLGGCFHNLEKFSEAIDYLQTYCKKNPTDCHAKLILANSCYKSKKYNEAIEIAQEIPDDFPQYSKAIQLIGGCFFEQGKSALAIETFKKAPLGKRKLDDDLKEVHYNLAIVYQSVGNKKSALKHLHKIYIQDTAFRDVSEKISQIESI